MVKWSFILIKPTTVYMLTSFVTPPLCCCYFIFYSVWPTKSAAWNRCHEKPDSSTCVSAVSCNPDRWIHLYGHGGMLLKARCTVSTLAWLWLTTAHVLGFNLKVRHRDKSLGLNKVVQEKVKYPHFFEHNPGLSVQFRSDKHLIGKKEFSS